MPKLMYESMYVTPMYAHILPPSMKKNGRLAGPQPYAQVGGVIDCKSGKCNSLLGEPMCLRYTKLDYP